MQPGGEIFDEGEVSRRCPVCGQPNHCGLLTAANEPCWCFKVTVSEQALAKIPADCRDRICLCQQCLSE